MQVTEVAQWVIGIVLAAVFLFMGVLHFIPGPGRGMAAMIPPFFKRTGWPSSTTLVRFTGLCEIAGGIGLLFPANAYAAKHPDKFGRAAFPFWPRLFAQLALILLCALAIA